MDDATTAPGTALTPMETTELASIEESMRDNTSSYWRDERAQSRWRELDQRRTAAPAPVPADRDEGAAGEMDSETTKALAEAYELDEGAVEVGRDICTALDRAFGSDAVIVNAELDGWPDSLRRAAVREMATPYVPRVPAAGRAEIEAFQKTDAGGILANRWRGDELAQRLGVALHRVERFEAGLSASDLQAWRFFYHRTLTPEQRAALLDKLTA